MIGSDEDFPWKWVVAAWSVPIVLSAFATFANSNDTNHPITISRAVWLGIAAWAVWIPLTHFIVRLGQRWPLDRRMNWRFVTGHLVAAAAAGCLVAAVNAVLVYERGRGTALAAFALTRITIRAPMWSTLYFIVLGVSYLAINTMRLRKQELQAERLSRELTESQLGALRMQLQPHFLFNSLNAVMALVRDQATERADRALMLLSDVLRATLREETRSRVPLTDELTFIRNYLEIELLRFGDRLRVTYTVPAALGNVKVPTFILQPLVENALHHGLMSLPDGGTLEIRAERHAGMLLLSVVDDGVGLSSDWDVRAASAVGLNNVRKRLEHMYGASGKLTIASRADCLGTCASVELPFEIGA